MVKVQEAENQIVTDYEVYDRRPYDLDLLMAAIETHEARLGRTPRLVAADAGILLRQERGRREGEGCQTRLQDQSLDQEPCAQPRAEKALGSATVRNGAPDARDASAWSSDDTASRPLPIQGLAGMNRWVGLGIIADNVVISRPCDGKTDDPINPRSPLRRCARLVAPGGFCVAWRNPPQCRTS